MSPHRFINYTSIVSYHIIIFSNTSYPPFDPSHTYFHTSSLSIVDMFCFFLIPSILSSRKPDISITIIHCNRLLIHLILHFIPPPPNFWFPPSVFNEWVTFFPPKPDHFTSSHLFFTNPQIKHLRSSPPTIPNSPLPGCVCLSFASLTRASSRRILG